MRLISEDGVAVGIIDLAEARKQAATLGVDLVEISGNANPPVVKLINYKKFLYQEARKEKEAKKKTHRVEMKELWLGPLIGEHDLLNRVGRGKDFLKTGDHVKFTVRFSGREMAHRENGYKVIEKVKGLLAEDAEVEKEPVFLGRQLAVSFKPKKT